MRALNISIVGATGAVGAELIRRLEVSPIPVNRLRLLASRNSAGRQVRFRDEICFVEALDEIGDLETDIAFLCAGSAVSAEWGPRVAAQGALVIDNSSTFRMDPDVPLVVPQINPSVLSHRSRPGIVANPNCTTIQLARALRPPVTALDVHSEAVYLEFEKPVRLEQVHQLLARARCSTVCGRNSRRYPTPRFIINPEDVHVARVRVNSENPRGLWLWVVADNLQVGAALNALLIAQLAIANGLVGEK
ncbi:aspartate-semialdehyde dehydrogenase [Sinorhizobium medicae]|uniref:aspartate-semialdehyde dehydrogenase n=1 Tax=Sinorhizobium medicae TaxID=110321 RepID=UPI0004257957|nr:Asd/ArgC dimerization domain-containing protein [Sinorhizobium medicae]